MVAFDGTGVERVVVLDTVTAAAVTARVADTRRGVVPALHLTLLQGVPKGAKMDAIVRMGTELGVMDFVPFISARTVASGRGRVDRWRRIAVEAAKQCRRSDLPSVHSPVPLAAALERLLGTDLVVVLWEGEQQRTLADALGSAAPVRRVALIVGPEGGLKDEEVQEAVRRGAVPVTLGPLVLRTETAGVAALAMVVYELTLRRSATAGPGTGNQGPDHH